MFQKRNPAAAEDEPCEHVYQLRAEGGAWLPPSREREIQDAGEQLVHVRIALKIARINGVTGIAVMF